uniref:Uncharacterized protein n=1 Tax=Anguilla anguilla TaxID=7936 RepID=A0A0E9X1R1_ANGAN
MVVYFTCSYNKIRGLGAAVTAQLQWEQVCEGGGTLCGSGGSAMFLTHVHPVFFLRLAGRTYYSVFCPPSGPSFK